MSRYENDPTLRVIASEFALLSRSQTDSRGSPTNRLIAEWNGDGDLTVIFEDIEPVDPSGSVG